MMKTLFLSLLPLVIGTQEAAAEASVREVVDHHLRLELSSSRRESVARAIDDWADPPLAMALIGRESGWRPNMKMQTGAYGLAQVLPSTFHEHTRKMGWKRMRTTEPAHNVRVGLSYLSWLISRYRQNIHLALAAYNWGPGNVDRVGRNWERVPGSVQSYVRDIIQARARLRLKIVPVGCRFQRGYAQTCFAMCQRGDR